MPVGSLLDIPTGEYLLGTHGQMVLLAGLSNITGIVGPGNCFKTTIMRYMILCALARLAPVANDDLYYSSYDTEINNHEHRNHSLYMSFEVFKGRNIIDEGMWQPTDKTIYPGNKYWARVKESLKDKRENKKKTMYTTCFIDRDGVSPMKTMCPTFGDFDSLSQFITEDVEATMEKTELGESAGNTIFMRQGLAKARMLMEMPTVAGASLNYFSFTAHIGKMIEMPSAPGTPPARKQLQHMPQGEIIKGVSNNFFYLLHNCWLVHSARPYLNQGTKAPEYPYEPGDELAGDLDLNIVTMKQLRGKNGGSGFSIELLVSQREGVQPSLSEFHYIKSNGRYGLEGNDRNYNVVFCPDIALSRTTVRKKLRENLALRRAVNLVAEMYQMDVFMPQHRDVMMTPDELYTALKAKGCDWNWLLENTRGWNGLNDEELPLYPLSTLDFCRMARGQYHPYWLEADFVTVKPEFKKLKKVA
jgi:hypothetical protein